MTHLSSSQLRAARGLLNWSRADLSERSGISAPTIHRFENGTHKTGGRIANKLIEVFARHGVEFSEYQGVRFRPSEIEVYDGSDRFNAFYDFLFEHLEQFGGEVCLSIYDETILQRLRSDPTMHTKRMKKLFDQKKLLSFRILTTISRFDGGGYASYRWFPDLKTSSTAFYAFGDCLALLSFVNEQDIHVVVIRSAPLAEGYKRDFNIAWKSGRQDLPPKIPLDKPLPKNFPAYLPRKK